MKYIHKNVLEMKFNKTNEIIVSEGLASQLHQRIL